MSRLRLGLVLGVCASLATHVGLFMLMRWAGELPEVGFELELPSQIELGVSEGGELAAGALGVNKTAAPETTPPSASEVVAPTPPEPSQAVKPVPKPKQPRRPKPKPRDAGSHDDADAGAKDAGKSGAEGTRAPALAAYAPPGAQLALRIDLDRVRGSVLAADASALLAAIPDVAFIMDGSGVDPLADLSRLFIASPNLQRSNVVLAGRYVGSDEVPRLAVENLARARGTTAKWSKRGGIAIAPWENSDSTARVLALLAPQLFAITRPEDLPRIVSVARALAKRKSAPDHTASDDEAADALLAMEDNEVVAFSVENAKSFAHGSTAQVPERLSISIRLQSTDAIEVVSTGTYASEADATQALSFWENIRDKFARHPLVALVGMSEPLRATSLVTDHETLVARSVLSVDQVQRILAFARDMLASRNPSTRGRNTAGDVRAPAALDSPDPRVQPAPEQ